MSLINKLFSAAAGASLTLSVFSSNPNDAFSPKITYQLNTPAAANSQRLHLDIDFIIDEIPGDRASMQFYFGESEKPGILYRAQDHVAEFFSIYGIVANIQMKKGCLAALSSDHLRPQKETEGFLKVFYLKNDRLKSYYEADPERFFKDTEGSSWLADYYKLNFGKINVFASILGHDAITNAIKEGLSRKFKEEWGALYQKEISGGLAAPATKRSYVYPLHATSGFDKEEDEAIAKALSVIEIHGILHDLGVKDIIYIGGDKRNSLGSIMTSQTLLLPVQYDIIAAEIKKIERMSLQNTNSP